MATRGPSRPDDASPAAGGQHGPFCTSDPGSWIDPFAALLLLPSASLMWQNAPARRGRQAPADSVEQKLLAQHAPAIRDPAEGLALPLSLSA